MFSLAPLRAALSAVICTTLLPIFALSAPQKPADQQVSLSDRLARQIALEREAFSPGLVDGKLGPKTALALREYQAARGLPVSGEFDAATLEKLAPPAEPLQTYAITAEDLAQVTGIPATWPEKAKMARLGYETLADELGEKFHTSQALLSTLNPGVDMANLKPGDTLKAPVIASTSRVSVDRLEVNFAEKVIRGFDKDGKLVALFHCSIAAHQEKRPEGSAKVVGVTIEPSYLFDPVNWPEVKDVKQRLMLPPGPRSPVGLCWIALDKPGYGIHGTPHPEMIGKTGSHGCFRMTNWDALRLGKMVRAGIEVTFIKANGENERRELRTEN